MKLADYLKANDLTMEQFAEKIGRTAATVSRIAGKVNRPDWSTMDAIHRATEGAVTPLDFMDEAAADDQARAG